MRESSAGGASLGNDATTSIPTLRSQISSTVANKRFGGSYVTESSWNRPAGYHEAPRVLGHLPEAPFRVVLILQSLGNVVWGGIYQVLGIEMRTVAVPA